MLNPKPYRRPDSSKDIPSVQGPPPVIKERPIRCFGLELGNQLADQGVAQVALGNEQWVAEARRQAMAYARQHGSVTSDDVHRLCPPPSDAHPNLMGAVWRKCDLQAVGYKQSERPSARGRVIRVWGPK